MKQAIAGVTPAAMKEVTVMTVWPSVARFAPARIAADTLFGIKLGAMTFTLGNLIALMLAPLGALLYLAAVAPGIGTRYRVTNRRVIVERGMIGSKEGKSIRLDGFDRIDLEVLPGQGWYDAGELIFRQGDTEVFRLPGVSRPEAFRQVCLKSRTAFVGVQQALGQPLVA
jgi:hypothetical protein